MSGGSFDYLCFKDSLCERTDDLKRMADELRERGHGDVAASVEGARQFAGEANQRLEELRDVFKAVEWVCSGDWGDDTITRAVEKWRASHPAPVAEAFRHEVTLRWSDEDGAYIARVPSMPGCMADGETMEAAVSMLRDVAWTWVEAGGKPDTRPAAAAEQGAPGAPEPASGWEVDDAGLLAAAHVVWNKTARDDAHGIARLVVEAYLRGAHPAPVAEALPEPWVDEAGWFDKRTEVVRTTLHYPDHHGDVFIEMEDVRNGDHMACNIPVAVLRALLARAGEAGR